MVSVTVPSGIGDASWIYSKLCHLESPTMWEVADGAPYRTVPYLQLLDKVAGAKYSDVGYSTIVQLAERARTWAEIEVQQKGMLYLEVNQHLEQGKRLEDWLPDLPTDFHYKFKPPTDRDLGIVNKLLAWDSVPRPIVGISAASYRGANAWNTWGYDQWSPFLRSLQARTGGTVVLLGGYWDDLTHSLLQDGHPDFVGKTNISQAIEVLRRLDYYVGFSSGLGILRTVLDRPTYMLWPDHQTELMCSWAPMHMIEDQTYSFGHWEEPREVLARVLDVMPTHQGTKQFSLFEKPNPELASA